MYRLSVSPVVPITSFIAIKSPIFLMPTSREWKGDNYFKIVSDSKMIARYFLSCLFVAFVIFRELPRTCS